MMRHRLLPFVLVTSLTGAALTAMAQNSNAVGYDIAFAYGGQGEGVYRMRGDGSALNMLVAEPFAIVPQGGWSPDGHKIAHFAVGAEDVALLKKSAPPALHFSLHVVNADGSAHTPLGVLAEPALAWSPDSTRLAFSSSVDPRASDAPAPQARERSASAIYILDIDTRRITRVTTLGDSRFMSWSPDGRRIVFSGSLPGTRADIYVVDASGATPPERIVSGPTPDVQPAWSPQGDEIAFVAAPLGPDSTAGGVFMTTSSGAAPRRISTSMSNRVQWSADGQSVLISGRPTEIVGVDTGTSVDLGVGLMDPTFAPDGRHVIYRTLDPATAGIYAVDAGGQTRRKLLDSRLGVSSFSVSPMLRR